MKTGNRRCVVGVFVCTSSDTVCLQRQHGISYETECLDVLVLFQKM